MPEGIQRAAFSKGPLRQIAASLSDGDNTYSQRSVALCRSVTARTVIEGQRQGIDKLLITSLPELLRFYITGHIYDETKLWSRTKGWGYR
eukprot:4602300-Karenia_brevis.AAC.1